jgi:predicted DNA-binding protein with PD1-like motif/type 1 glutamine amidotransferase
VKRPVILIASIVSIVGAWASAQQPAPTAPAAPAAPPKLAVLIVTGQNGHNWRGTTPLLRKALEDTGKFEVRVTEEFRGAGPETLAPYDLVVLNYFERGRPELRWGDKTNAAFLDYLRSGKGVVVYHFSMAAFDGWTDYEKISGGNWRPNNGHHSAPHNFVVDVKDQEHPITKGLKLSFPQANDELYANLRWQPAGSYHVLATANDDHALYAASRTDSRAPQPLEGASANEPMLWTTEFGKGRVFVTALGHDVEQVQTPAFVTTFTRGAEWAATGKVTLPIPAGMASAPQSAQGAAQAPTPEGYVPRGTRPGKGLAPGMKVADLGKGARTYRISMTKGDEIMSGLTDFAEKYHIRNGHFTALGAINKGLFGWSDVERGLGQKKIELNQEAEIVSLMGSVTTDAQGRGTVHGHGTVALSDGSVKGGHWWEAHVSIIADVFVTEEEGAAEQLKSEPQK